LEKSHENPSGDKGRPFKVYERALIIPKIIDSIEKERDQKVKGQLDLSKKCGTTSEQNLGKHLVFHQYPILAIF